MSQFTYKQYDLICFKTYKPNQNFTDHSVNFQLFTMTPFIDFRWVPWPAEHDNQRLHTIVVPDFSVLLLICM
jgi:hypothetical protein